MSLQELDEYSSLPNFPITPSGNPDELGTITMANSYWNSGERNKIFVFEHNTARFLYGTFDPERIKVTRPTWTNRAIAFNKGALPTDLVGDKDPREDPEASDQRQLHGGHRKHPVLRRRDHEGRRHVYARCRFRHLQGSGDHVQVGQHPPR